MRGSKAKKLRKFVKENFSNMPVCDYVSEKGTTFEGKQFSVIKLIGSCKRTIYRKLKKETRSGVSFA